MVVDTSALVAILMQEEDAQTYPDAIAMAKTAVASYVELAIISLSRGGRGRAELEATLADAAIETVSVTVDQVRLRRRRIRKVWQGATCGGAEFRRLLRLRACPEPPRTTVVQGIRLQLTDAVRT